MKKKKGKKFLKKLCLNFALNNEKIKIFCCLLSKKLNNY